MGEADAGRFPGWWFHLDHHQALLRCV